MAALQAVARCARSATPTMDPASAYLDQTSHAVARGHAPGGADKRTIEDTRRGSGCRRLR